MARERLPGIGLVLKAPPLPKSCPRGTGKRVKELHSKRTNAIFQVNAFRVRTHPGWYIPEAQDRPLTTAEKRRGLAKRARIIKKWLADAKKYDRQIKRLCSRSSR